jgi:hypothetical protein
MLETKKVRGAPGQRRPLDLHTCRSAMVDLNGSPEGPIGHGFSNGIFVIPAVIVISLSGIYSMNSSCALYC